MELTAPVIVGLIGFVAVLLIIVAVIANSMGWIDIGQIFLEFFCLLKINMGLEGFLATKLIGFDVPGGWAGCPT